MKKIAALIQITVICLVVGYGTFQMFKGNFEMAFASLPLLMGYYVFFVGFRKRAELHEEEEDGAER